MRGARSTSIVAALLACVLSGCALVDANKTKLRMADVRTNPADRKSPRDRYVQALGKGAGPDSGAFARALAPIELWAPFTLELTAGVFEPEAREATLGAAACLELASVDTPGEPAAFVCADFLQGLTQTRASVETSLVEEHFAVFQVEMQLEATEDTLFFRSRDRGATSWVDVASMPFAQTGALLAGLSVHDLQKKGRIGFDDLRFDRSGVSPEPPTDTRVFIGHVENALVHQYSACVELDGADIDFASAQIELEAARLALENARLQLLALPESNATRKATKRIAQADKKTGAALSKIAKGKEVPAIKRVEQAIRRAAEAILLIDPRGV